MYRIGELSKITGLSVKTLRYYDKEGLLLPSKRDDQTGYRYYDEKEFRKALVIKEFRALSFGIAEVKEILAICDDDGDFNFVLLEKQKQIQAEILKQEQLIQRINASIKITRKEELFMNYVIDVKTVPEVTVATIRYRGKYNECGAYAGKIYKAIGGKAAGNFFNLYHQEEFDDNADIEVCVPIKGPVKGVESRKIPAIKALSTQHIGSYDNLGNAYKALFDFATEKGYETTLPTREVYIKGPGMLFKGNPNKYVTEVMLPIKA